MYYLFKYEYKATFGKAQVFNRYKSASERQAPFK